MILSDGRWNEKYRHLLKPPSQPEGNPSCGSRPPCLTVRPFPFRDKSGFKVIHYPIHLLFEPCEGRAYTVKNTSGG
jgi:hypothetical protein